MQVQVQVQVQGTCQLPQLLACWPAQCRWPGLAWRQLSAWGACRCQRAASHVMPLPAFVARGRCQPRLAAWSGRFVVHPLSARRSSRRPCLPARKWRYPAHPCWHWFLRQRQIRCCCRPRAVAADQAVPDRSRPVAALAVVQGPALALLSAALVAQPHRRVPGRCALPSLALARTRQRGLANCQAGPATVAPAAPAGAAPVADAAFPAAFHPASDADRAVPPVPAAKPLRCGADGCVHQKKGDNRQQGIQHAQ